MSKALSFVCLALLICFGGSAWAKPKIAVLGLEVIPGPTGAVDPEATQAARDITKELRHRVQSSASPYAIAPNSSKELTDEKLLMSCDNEVVTCMAVIGTGLTADMLLYGHIELKDDVYRVSLILLDVKAKTVQSSVDDMPVGGSASAVSKRLYVKMIGDVPGPSGTLVVKARAQAGTEINAGAVMIDEERKGNLAGGKLAVAGVAEGRHTVAIEASGYRRYEETVTVHGGEQVIVDARLIEKVEKVAPSPETQNNLPWKVTLGAGAAVVGAGLAYAYYSYERMLAHRGSFEAAIDRQTGMPYTDKIAAPDASDCGQSPDQIAQAKHSKVLSQSDFDRACTWKTRIYISFVVAGVGALGAVTSLIMLSRDSGPSERPATAARNKKPDIAFMPMWMPDGGGASLSVRW